MVFANRQPERWIDAEIICIAAIFKARCYPVNSLTNHLHQGVSCMLRASQAFQTISRGGDVFETAIYLSHQEKTNG